MFLPRPPARSRLMDCCWYYSSHIFPNVFLGHWEHCFFTNWARLKFYATKIPPFEREFHAEFENEGPGASFLDFDAVFNDFSIKQNQKIIPAKKP